MADSIDELLAGLSPDARKRASRAIDVVSQRQALPSIGLTRALNGGLGYGRQVMIWGTKSASKTSLTLQTIAEAQKEGRTCAFFDVEGGYDSEWAERLGVDTENLIISVSKSMEKVTNDAAEMMRAGIDLLAIDSITSLTPSAYLDGDDLKPMEKTGRIGAMSSDLSRALNMLNYANDHTLMILISQVRMQSKGMYFGMSDTGGQSGKFYSSQVIKLWSSESNDYTLKGEAKAGNRLIEQPIGRRVDYTVEYNKLGPQSRQGSYDFYYDGDFVGVDRQAEIVDIATEFGIVERKGAWYNFGDQKWQGRDSLVDAVRDDPELFDAIKKEVL